MDYQNLLVPRYALNRFRSRLSTSDPLELQVIRERGAPKFDVSKASDKPSSLKVAIVSLYSLPSTANHFQQSFYDSFAPFTLANILYYANRHRYPFFFLHSSLVADLSTKKSIYWSKLSILEHYLASNMYEWILWTDIDVMFLKMGRPLSYFVDQIPPSYHIGAVLECGRTNKEYLTRAIRSGFFFLRNSKESLSFLKKWRSLQANYVESETPEQDALEHLFADPEWQRLFYVFPTKALHCYSECATEKAFSVHFPNTPRKHTVKDWADKLFPDLKPIFIRN